MSEFQYYEFRTVDRPLSAGDRKALRAISTRAEITATCFTNSYSWGDLKGDPADFMARWFDLHVYLTNWGTRRFMLRLPKRLVDVAVVQASVARYEHLVTVRLTDEHLILYIAWTDISRGPMRRRTMSGSRRNPGCRGWRRSGPTASTVT